MSVVSVPARVAAVHTSGTRCSHRRRRSRRHHRSSVVVVTRASGKDDDSLSSSKDDNASSTSSSSSSPSTPKEGRPKPTPRSKDVATAFKTAGLSGEIKARVATSTDLDALRAKRDEAKARLAKAELAYATAVLAREKSEDEDDGTFGSRDEEAFECSYGYIANLAGCYIDIERNGVPQGLASMAGDNFLRELREMMDYLKDGEGAVEAKRKNMSEKLRRKLSSLRLSSSAIAEREAKRPEVPAPWILKVPYDVLCLLLDKLFEDDKPIQRFWFLETVARMPYFSYTSMLTFYEILGWWRRSSELRKVHFAEEWNEYHHLLIMESLGGDASWRDRFLGQHAAIVYYFVLVLLWLISPALAYNFSELIEAHAVDTYATFVDENEALLKTMPPPRIAVEYYQGADLYLFDEFQTARDPKSRRPKIESMYDVFANITQDEGEHVSTMNACQREDAIIGSPNAVNAKTAAVGALITAQLWFQRVAENAAMSETALDVDALADSAITDTAATTVFDAILRILDFM